MRGSKNAPFRLLDQRQQVGLGANPQRLDEARPAKLNSSQADVEFGGNLAIRQTADDPLQNGAFFRAEGAEFRLRLKPIPPTFPISLLLFESPLDGFDEPGWRTRLLQEIHDAEFHRLDCQGDLRIAGDNHRGAIGGTLDETPHQLKAGHPRHSDVQDEAPASTMIDAIEKRSGRRETLGSKPLTGEDGADGAQNARIVVNDKDNGLVGRVRSPRRPGIAHATAGVWRWRKRHCRVTGQKYSTSST